MTRLDSGDEVDVIFGSDGKDAAGGSTGNDTLEIRKAPAAANPNANPANLSLIGGFVGQQLGSAIGQAIGGSNPLVRIASSTALGFLLNNAGSVFGSLMQGNTLSNALDQTFAHFGSSNLNFANDMKSLGAGAVASLLTGELAEALDIGNSFGGQLLTTTGGSLLGTVLNNAATSQTDLFAGVSGNLYAGVSSMIGGYLAREIYTPQNVGGSIGGSVGGAVGSAIGTAIAFGQSTAVIGSVVGGEILASVGLATAIGSASTLALGILIPGIGALIGTLLGSVAGDFLGKLFGLDSSTLIVDEIHLRPGTTAFERSDDNALLDAMGKMVSTFVAATGGEVAATNDYRIKVSDKYYSGSKHRYHTEVWETSPLGQSVKPMADLEGGPWYTDDDNKKRIDHTVVDVIKRLDIAGGSIYAKRALDNTKAKTIEELAGDLKIAEDYERYLSEKDVIDAIVALNPDSTFAAGWLITLVRAKELELDKLNETDFVGGLAGFIRSFDLERFGATAADVTFSVSGANLVMTINRGAGKEPEVLTIPNYATFAGLQLQSQAGRNDRDNLWFADAAGDSYTDLSARADGFSNDTLIGHNGIDTITGGVGADFIKGGANNDILDGGSGHDVIAGGTGNDTLRGGSGNDVYVFSRGDGVDSITDAGVRIARDTPRIVDGVTVYDTVAADGTIGNPIDGGSDILQFGRGISANDLIFDLDGNDLVIGVRAAGNTTQTLADTWDRMRLKNWNGGWTRVERIVFVDGSSLETEDILRKVFEGGDTTEVFTTIAGESLTIRLDGADNRLTTGAGDEIIFGEGGRDILRTGDGADILIGSAGNDFLDGQGGDDVLRAGLGTDQIFGGNGTDRVDYLEAVGWVSLDLQGGSASEGDGGSDTVSLVESAFGSNFNDTLRGTEGSNLLYGRDGNDTLLGRGGDDIIKGGGAGSSTYDGGAGIDTIDYRSLKAVSTDPATGIYISLQASSTERNDGYVDAITNFENVTGSDLNDIIAGNSGANILIGGEGDDIIHDKGGADLMSGGAGKDRFVIVGDDALTIDGGDWTDIADYSTYWSGISVGVDTTAGAVPTSLKVVKSGGVDSLTNVESIKGTASNDSFTLGAGNNVVWAGGGSDFVSTGDGDDTLDGGAGGDALNGGAGLDIASYASAGSGVVADLATASNNTGEAAGDSYSSIEGLVGSANNDTLRGDSSGNLIDGGGGADTMSGGDGSDTYVIDNASDIVSESGGTGIDEVVTTLASYTIGSTIEILRYDGASSFTGLGNSGANKIYGGSKNDTLNGAAGADTMEGGKGNDTYFVDSASDVIVEADGNGNLDEVRTALTTYQLSTGVEVLRYTGIAAFSGTGNSSDNSIIGGSSADTLDGRAGADELEGGQGNDTYVIDSAEDVVVEAANQGVDEVHATGSAYTLGSNIEVLRRIGSGSFNGYGNALDNALYGGAGNELLAGLNGDDTIHGSAGTDNLQGGEGVDKIVFLSLGTGLTINLSTGSTTKSDGKSDTISGFEYVVGTNYADIIQGNSSDNTLDGASGNDTIRGWGGDDVIFAGSGSANIDGGADTDTVNYSGAPANYRIILDFGTSALLNVNKYDVSTNAVVSNDEIKGTERAIGTQNNDVFRGSNAADAFWGQNGADLFLGRLGGDSLFGGEGNDTYELGRGDALVDTAGTGSDAVAEDGGYDRLRLIDADFVRSQVSFSLSGSNLLIRIDSNGTSGAYDQVRITNWLGSESARLEEIEFSDGSVIGVSEMIYRVDPANTLFLTIGGVSPSVNGTSQNDTSLTGTSGANIIRGYGGDDVMNGSGGHDTFDGGLGIDTVSYASLAGGVTASLSGGFVTKHDSTTDAVVGVEKVRGTNYDDIIHGNAADNTIVGNGGNDIVRGWDGNDTIYVDEGADNVDGGNGSDRISFGFLASTKRAIIHLGTGNLETRLVSTNALVSTSTMVAVENAAGSAQGDTFWGSSSANEIYAGAGNDSIQGYGGDDYLVGGEGNDSVIGSAGSDTYAFNLGDGQDTITNSDASTASTDSLSITGGVTENQIWLGRNGNDLLVSIIGTGDSIRMQNWYTDASAKLDRVLLSNGHVLQSSQVDTLVNAMAAYTTSSGLANSTITSTTSQSSVQLAVSSVWA